GFELTLSFATIHQARAAFRKARAHVRGRRTPEGGRLERSHRREAVFTWRNFFWVVDGALKIAERRPPAALRRKALRAAEGWMLPRMEHSGGLGAIFPPMVNALMALRCLGYPDDHPQVVRARRELEAFEIEEGDTLRMQPCFSPVWD